MAAKVAPLVDVSLTRRERRLHDSGASGERTWNRLLQLCQLLQQFGQLQLRKSLFIDDRTPTKKVVEQIILLSCGAPVPGSLDDLAPFQLPFTEVATPDQAE